MMTKGLSIFIAILAIAAGAEAKKKNKPPKSCEEQKKCDKCLNDEKCAWWVKGNEQKCVSANRCFPNDEELFGGTCQTGSTFPDINKACRRMKKEKPPLKCKEYNGKGNCYGCLTNGCAWVNEKQKCVKSCDDAPRGTTCEGSPSNGRKLLSFVDAASGTCYYLDNDYEDMVTCKAANGDCTACSETLLTPRWPDFGDEPYIFRQTCGFNPETGKCVPDGGDKMCPNADPCDKRWPELQLKNVAKVVSYLELNYDYNVVLCPEGEPKVVLLPNPDYIDDRFVIVEPPNEVVPLPNPLEPVYNDDRFVIEEPQDEVVQLPNPLEPSQNAECYTKDDRCDRVRIFFDVDIIGAPIVKNLPQVG